MELINILALDEDYNKDIITNYHIFQPKYSRIKITTKCHKFIKNISYNEISSDEKTYNFQIQHKDLNILNSDFIRLDNIYIEYSDSEIEHIYYDNNYLHKLLLQIENEGNNKIAKIPLEYLPICYYTSELDKKNGKLFSSLS